MFGNKSQPQKKSAPQMNAPKPASAPAAPAVDEDDDIEAANYISSGTVIEGNIISSEDLQLDGTVKGDIRTTSRLILGPDSIVEGNIVAAEAEVSGRITGTVESKGLLAIRSTCVIEGDIVTKSLNVESGSSFNGRCQVGTGATDAKPVPAAAPTGPVARPAPLASGKPAETPAPTTAKN